MNDAVNLNFSTADAPYILRANFSVIQKETGFINGLITVLHDITEQEKLKWIVGNSSRMYHMS